MRAFLIGLRPRMIPVVLGTSVAVLLAGGCERTESWIERRKSAFERVAQLANEPLLALRPFQARIASSGKGELILLDSRRDACLEAAPYVEKLGAITFPPDEQGKAIESAEGLHRAAGGFLEGISECRPGDGVAAFKPQAMPGCIARCMHAWKSLVRSAERLREDADWLGVHVEPIAPPEEMAQ